MRLLYPTVVALPTSSDVLQLFKSLSSEFLLFAYSFLQFLENHFFVQNIAYFSCTPITRFSWRVWKVRLLIALVKKYSGNVSRRGFESRSKKCESGGKRKPQKWLRSAQLLRDRSGEPAMSRTVGSDSSGFQRRRGLLFAIFLLPTHLGLSPCVLCSGIALCFCFVFQIRVLILRPSIFRFLSFATVKSHFVEVLFPVPISCELCFHTEFQ